MKDIAKVGVQRRISLEADASAALSCLTCSAYFESKRIVITGATGMLGGWIAYMLAQMKVLTGYGPEAVLILRSGQVQVTPIWEGLIPARNISFWAPGSSDPVIPEADIYLHLASPASARDFLLNPGATLDLNIRGTAALLTSAGRVKGSRLLFVSSSEIYGIAPGPLSESTVGMVPLDSRRWIYAESKRLGELICRAYGETGDVSTVVVRPFHTFGPGLRLDDPRIFGDFISAIHSGRKLIVQSDPSTMRTFCYAPEAASAFLLATARGVSGDVFNVAGQVPMSIGALAESLTREFLPAGSTVEYLNPTGAASATNPVHESIADTRSIRALGWVSPTDALGAFRRTIEYLGAGDSNLPQQTLQE